MARPARTRHRRPSRQRQHPASVQPEAAVDQTEAETVDLMVSLDAADAPLVVIPTGSPLLDGLRCGIARHGWTVTDVVQRADLPAQFVVPALGWAPGQPVTEVVRWALVLDAIAAEQGRRFHYLLERRSTLGLGQVAWSLLEGAGCSWPTMAKRLAPRIAGEPSLITSDLDDGELAFAVLDRLGLVAGVAPVLVAAPPVAKT